ncbi:alpha/beta hydrolase family protein [Rubrobacter indicoceani]|uniref:S9 family peptidase n=1 Tax=Rubrobacter indicoceani TaxID=2051957 RepID=UPI000E5C2403|nr:S9 family peptidase [Rubrobacter indicoceani]
MPEVAPYGSWRSPISAGDISSGGVGLGQIQLDGEAVYWSEVRPKEGGRTVIVRRAEDGSTTDVNPAPFNARTRVHEYGGGSYVVHAGTVYFSNFSDQRVYRIKPGGEPEPLTDNDGCRYADFSVDVSGDKLLCVREDHRSGGEPVNEVVALSLSDGSEKVLASGRDFYASPCSGRDGEFLACLGWDHPNMPWDGTELLLLAVDENGDAAGEPRVVAGGPSESVLQPRFDHSPGRDGDLYFISDRTGWWNLYRFDGDGISSLHEKKAEFAGPQWQLGTSRYDFLPDGRLVCAYLAGGISHLAVLDPETGDLGDVDLPYSVIGGVRAGGGSVYFNAGSSSEPSVLAGITLGGEVRVIKRSREVDLDTGYLSSPETVEFPTGAGLTAHAFYYGPKNRDYRAPEGELPPLIVMSHGGPTSMTSSAFSLGVQFWTSRGFAVLDVNYGGSSGYGREYRERLNGNWGVVDVADCANGAKYLADQGLVDGDRLAITGGSAGGYTTLSALAFTDVFSAGASHYGVSDLTALAKETHKFESRYLDGLIGPYPAAEGLYRERSPINHVEGLSAPVVFFQGLEDRIVPPNQAEMMVAALREKGIPVAYVPFEGEQHGFRRSENIERALEGELYFYSKVFGFEPADDIEPLTIENL